MDLQVRWAKPLPDALLRDPEGVLLRARASPTQPGQRGVVDVFGRLIGLAPQLQARQTVISSGKKRRAVLRADPKGKATVEFEPGMLWVRQHKSLAKRFKCFLTDPAAA